MRNAQGRAVKRGAPPAQKKGVAQTPPEETPPPETPPAETPPAETPPPTSETPAETPPATPPAVEPPPEAPVEPQPIEEVSDDIVGEAEVIVITGSLVERRELTTPAPVTVIDRSDIEVTGLVSAGQVLERLPSQSNNINMQVNNGGDGSQRVNLRGLGEARTLVLLNGRRIVPMGTGANASIDMNVIPLAAIERIEVLKDGASAIYGSDAIGGVVNVITRDDFEGQEVTLYTGQSGEGDGTVYDMSFVTGASSKKSNIMFAASYTKQGEIWAGDRGFSTNDESFDYTVEDDPTTPEDERVSPAGSSSTPQGFIIPDLDADGVLDPGFDPAAFGNCDLVNVGICTRDFSVADPNGAGAWKTFDFGTDTYNFQPQNYLVTPNTRYSLFSTGNYRFHDRVRGFFEAMYNHRESEQKLAPMPLFSDLDGFSIHADNAYNPWDTDVAFYRRRLVEVSNRIFAQKIDTFRMVAGLDGDLPGDLPFLKNWKWELSYNYGTTRAEDTNDGQLILSHLINALGPSYDSDGDGSLDACGTMPGEVDSACVPLNLLGGYNPATGQGTVTPEMAAYVTYKGIASGYNQQRTFLGQARGPLFNTPWGGFAMLALGADYRQEEGGYSPDPLTATGDTTGNAQEPTQGDYDVVEGFGELSFVPVTGKGAVQWLELAGAVRGFDYSTFGSGVTYKGGFLFRTLGGVGFRGTYSTAFRAPSVGELYSGTADSFPDVTDPCDTSMEAFADKAPSVQSACMAQLQPLGVDPNNFLNPSIQLRSSVGGNPELEPEEATALTGGIVLEPPPVEGLALTVDYFQIEIDKPIQPVSAPIIINNCFNRGIASDCAKVHRFGNGIVDFIDDRLTNVGKLKTNGIDFSVGYNRSVSGAGVFRTMLDGTRLLSYEVTDPADQVREGVGVYDLGHFPKWRFNLSVLWGLKGVGLGTAWRYVHHLRECEDIAGGDASSCTDRDQARAMGDALGSRKVDWYIAGDVFASYEIKSPAGKTTIAAGVNNVTDATPGKIYGGFYADSDSSAYDFIGRYFYVRLSQLF